jgi:hypothetical protein
MPGTLRFAPFPELPDLSLEPVFFLVEVTWIGYDKVFGCGVILFEGGVIEKACPDERCQDTADKEAGRFSQPYGLFQYGRTMGHHLSDIHFAPLPGGSRA